jgi:predicted DNA-binding protein
MQTISMRLPDKLVQELNRAAKKRRVTKSQIVRESLEASLEPNKAGFVSCLDLVRDLAGSIKGGPADLATNPKYMEGFGE